MESQAAGFASNFSQIKALAKLYLPVKGQILKTFKSSTFKCNQPSFTDPPNLNKSIERVPRRPRFPGPIIDAKGKSSDTNSENLLFHSCNCNQ
ncbi:hypothetical protein DSO57_1030325 [Entomophthora muscae]|uniref:Uncharacterized protein n=1 Tax=Entomophthora muscae TaxID=34485 RepID=A0ACC2RFZ1_9FUNG|nr:hypothetical protein DSO57_1030325 [Entomophthora muscae]